MRGCLRSAGTALLVPLTAMGVACAHAPQSDAQHAMKPAHSERILVTGSHIPQRIDLDSQVPTTISPVRVYSREEIVRTGQYYDLRAALRDLDPSLSR